MAGRGQVMAGRGQNVGMVSTGVGVGVGGHSQHGIDQHLEAWPAY